MQYKNYESVFRRRFWKRNKNFSFISNMRLAKKRFGNDGVVHRLDDIVKCPRMPLQNNLSSSPCEVSSLLSVCCCSLFNFQAFQQNLNYVQYEDPLDAP